MGSPPKDNPEFAWGTKEQRALNGKFFLRSGLNDEKAKLWIRSEAINDEKNHRRHEAPLCGGYALFYKAKKPDPETKKPVFRAKLHLSLNLQRFIRHQPQQDDPRKLWSYKLQKRSNARSFFGEEQSLDGADNWLPNSLEWVKFTAKGHFPSYIELITKEVNADLSRACKHRAATLQFAEPYCVPCEVETFWEFPSDDPIEQTLDIGSKLMHAVRGDSTAKVFECMEKETGRVYNAPSFTIPLAQSVKLRVYAKTNKRIRFEIVQSDLRKGLDELRDEAEALTDHWKLAAEGAHWLKPPRCSPSELPAIMKALRKRAATHMNKVMGDLQKGRTKPVAARSVVDLLAQVAFAVRAGLKSRPTQFTEMKNLLYMLCYQRGFRGNRKEGPMAEALQALEATGVLKFDRSRLFYTLTPPYTKAADALVSASGEPLLSIFGSNSAELKAEKAKSPRARLRE